MPKGGWLPLHTANAQGLEAGGRSLQHSPSSGQLRKGRAGRGEDGPQVGSA